MYGPRNFLQDPSASALQICRFHVQKSLGLDELRVYVHGMGRKHSQKRPGAPGGRLIDGLVVGRKGPVVFVETSAGRTFACLGRGPGKSAVVGDRVGIRLDAKTELSEALVEKVHQRYSQLTRVDINRRRPQVLAANIDKILVVCALKPEMREGLVDRYIIAAHAQGIQPSLIFNKIDLIERDNERDGLASRLAIYSGLGYCVHMVSAHSKEGLADLRAALSERLSILVGHSGVGKTSLLNTLIPNLNENVQELSQSSGRGQHTTTSSTLYELEGGGAIIDSPGIRSFGLWGIGPEELRDYYPEFSALAEHCRFANCQHIKEPACAVRDAVATGAITSVRYENYVRIRASLKGDVRP